MTSKLQFDPKCPQRCILTPKWPQKCIFEPQNTIQNHLKSIIKAELQATIDHLAAQIANSEATMLYLSQQGTGLSVEELEKIRKENENLKKKLEKTEDKFDELEARLQCPICLS